MQEVKTADLCSSKATLNDGWIFCLAKCPQIRLKPDPMTPECTLPAEGAVGVDDAQRVERCVHHLLGAQKVHHHWNAQVSDQNGQRNVHHSTYQRTYDVRTQNQSSLRVCLVTATGLAIQHFLCNFFFVVFMRKQKRKLLPPSV